MKSRVIQLKEHFISIIGKPEMAILPGQLAYFLVLAVIPTITLVSIGAAFLNLGENTIYTFISENLSTEIANILLSEENSISSSGVSISLILVLGYIIAAKGVSSIIITSNAIYGIKNTNFIKRYTKAVLMSIIFVILLIFLLIVPMFGDLILILINNTDINEHILKNINFVVKFLQGPIFWCILFFIIKLIYNMAPDKKIESHTTNYGSLFTTISWILVTEIYSIYVTNIANYTAVYGNLANLIILMLWFYFLSYTFTIGLALNYHKEEEEA